VANTKATTAASSSEPYVLKDELVEAMKRLEQQVYLTPQEIDRSLRSIEERLKQLVEKPGPRSTR
jgi:hypothetical protein